MNTEVTKKKDYKLEDFAAEDAMITDFFRRNADKMPDVDLEFQRFKQQHIRPKTFSVTAIIAASAVAALIIAFLFYGSLSSTKVSKEPLVAYTADKNQRTDIVIQHDGSEEQVVNRNIIYYNTATNKKQTHVVINQLTTHNGKTICAILEDGTEVWLNANSRLVFPSKFDSKQRCVEVQGEAYFAVAKDTDRPFVVKAIGVTTKVLGTEFNINTYDTNNVMVTLVDGSLEVANDSHSKLIVPGDFACINSNGIKVENIDTYPVTAWKRGEFYFDNKQLLDVAREIGQWFNVSVIFNNREMASRRVFFTADRTAPLDEIAENLSIIGKVKIHLDNGQMTID